MSTVQRVAVDDPAAVDDPFGKPQYIANYPFAESGATSCPADMKGKAISTGSSKSGTEVIANRILQSAGLNPDTKISAQRLDLTKSVDGMKDGSIDGLIWSGACRRVRLSRRIVEMKTKG